MRIKKKLLIIVLLFLMIGIIILLINRISLMPQDIDLENANKSEIVISNNYEELKKVYIEDYLKGNENSFIFGYILAQKNGDWSRLPLTNEFRKKYNEKDGILGDVEYDNIEYCPYAGSNEDYYFKDYYTYFVITQGLEKTAYIYDTKYQESGYLLDDVYIREKIRLTDKEGNKLLIIGHSIDRNNYSSCFSSLCRGGDDEKSVAATEHFHKKYPYFLDLFIHYSPLGANEIRFNGGNWEDRIAYFEVDSVLECVKRGYEVKFEIDDNGYLNDATAICVKAEYYEREYIDYPYDAILYKNSNWNNLKITDKFKNKYNSKDGCLPDGDNINVTIGSISAEFIDLYTIVRNYAYKDGSNKWFCEKYVNDKKGYLDDIEFIPIDYNGTDAKIAKEIYLKSISR